MPEQDKDKQDQQQPKTLVDKVKKAAKDAALAAALKGRDEGKSEEETTGLAVEAARNTIPVAFAQENARKPATDDDKKQIASWDWEKDAEGALKEHDDEEKKKKEQQSKP